MSTIIPVPLARIRHILEFYHSLSFLDASLNYILFSFAYFWTYINGTIMCIFLHPLVLKTFFKKLALWNSPTLVHVAKCIHLLLIKFSHASIPSFTYAFSCRWTFVGFLGFYKQWYSAYSCICLWVSMCKSFRKVISSLWCICSFILF